MSIRTYKLIGSGGRGVGLGLLVLGAGLVIIGFGLVLLVTLGVAGALVWGAVMTGRRLIGRPPRSVANPRGLGLDPRLEVFADRDPTYPGESPRRLSEPAD